jgi:carbonic anhydrase/acetyltransferase-like protein (isoleucine patch superfamily)
MQRIQKLKQLQDHKRTEQLKPFIVGGTYVDSLTKQEVGQESKQKLKNQLIRPICPLSLEPIQKNKLYIGDCLHAFNIDYIKNWVEIQKNLTCPICRKQTVGFSVQIGTNLEYFVGNRHYNIFHVSDGGWVSHTAKVSRNAIISENAKIFGNAQVYGDAVLFGDARVFGNARVYGNAAVYGNAQVYGDARVAEFARVSGNAQVYEFARVNGDARVFGNALVYGNARVSGDAQVYGNAQVSGNAKVIMEKLNKGLHTS